MQHHNVNWRSLPNKSLGTAPEPNKRIIQLEQSSAYHRTQQIATVGYRNSHRNQTLELLTAIIGTHWIRSIDPVTDCQLSHSHHLITTNFQIVDLQWQGAFQLEQDAQANHYIIYLVLSGSLAQKIDAPQLYPQHQTVCCEPDTATILSPGQKLVSIASETGNALLISIERDSIDSTLSNLLDRPLKQPVIFLPSIDLTSELGLSLKKLLQFLWESTQDTGTATASLVMQKLEQAFLACAIEGLPSNYTEELLYQTDGALACHVHKARAFIESHLHEDIKLGDIAAATQVCSRLLQKAFSQHYGCSPMRFVTQTRLQRIRQDLESAPSDTKIVDVMMNYGFTQGGKFAKEYQQLFGEKPSETLKRCSQFHTQGSPLWQQIDDPRSEGIVGGANSSDRSVVTAGIKDACGLLARLRCFLT
jgi:AraC-like DNA-binding protein